MTARKNIVLELKGRIVADSVDMLESEISAQLGDSPTLAILDFSRVDEIGSAGVGLFIALQKRLRASGGDLILSGLRPRHQNFLDTLGFRNYFSVALDVETAIEYTGNLSRKVPTLTVSCPFCGSLAESDGPGRGRCRVCNAIYTVMDDGSVELG
jgi:anti-anti-sigma factor